MKHTELQLMNRIELLRSREGRANGNIIKKIEREIKHLHESK
jgi:hypothetical protein